MTFPSLANLTFFCHRTGKHKVCIQNIKKLKQDNTVLLEQTVKLKKNLQESRESGVRQRNFLEPLARNTSKHKKGKEMLCIQGRQWCTGDEEMGVRCESFPRVWPIKIFFSAFFLLHHHRGYWPRSHRIAWRLKKPKKRENCFGLSFTLLKLRCRQTKSSSTFGFLFLTIFSTAKCLIRKPAKNKNKMNFINNWSSYWAKNSNSRRRKHNLPKTLLRRKNS